MRIKNVDGMDAQQSGRIGEALRHLRARAEMTQQQVGDRMGVKQARISRIESGRYDPRLSVLVSYLGAVGADLKMLQGELERIAAERIAAKQQEAPNPLPPPESEFQVTKDREWSSLEHDGFREGVKVLLSGPMSDHPGFAAKKKQVSAFEKVRRGEGKIQ